MRCNVSARFLLSVVALVLTFADAVFSAEGIATGTVPAAIITRVRGQVTARKPGDEKVTILKVGDPIAVGHTVQSAENSGAQLVFADNSFVNIWPQTTLQVKQYDFTADTNRRSAIIKVFDGRARFVLYKRRSKDSNFAVETGQALITAGISDFFVSAGPSETEIANLGTSLGVKNISPLTVGTVRLDNNQKSRVTEKMPPSQPATVTPEQRRMCLNDAD